MIPTKFQFIWPCGFRGNDFLEIDKAQKGFLSVDKNMI